ncbi:MAG: SPFH domain-containing protein [Clostridia bacterium]|nr:SPFH domain-containing protein [Clostridia bacterium]
MGIFDMLRGQAIDVIEWKDPGQDTMVYRYDCGGKEIMMGAQLTVRESQVAIMVNEGQLADVFTPGRYELQTQNMPIMTALKSWKYGFNSPFKAEVYFINTKQFINQKWGTSTPVMMRDSEFGMVRILAHGIYSFAVSDPKTFLKEVFGTNGLYTTEYVAGQIKRTIVSGLSDAIAQSKIPALDLAANYDELGSYALQTLSPRLAPLGLKLTAFVIENISLPEEVQKAMDQRTSMGVVGDINKYTQFQAAAAMRDAANNQNGAAGMGTGLGAAAMMNQVMNGAFQAQPAQAAPAAAAAAGFCSNCGQPLTAGAKFCPSCGAKQGGEVCANCGAPLAADAKFCPQCGTKR